MFNPEQCATQTVDQHRVIIVALTNCPYSEPALRDAQSRLSKLGLVPVIVYYDDEAGIGKRILMNVFTRYTVRNWLGDGEHIRDLSQIASIQQREHKEVGSSHLLFPQVLWRQEVSGRDNDMAWAWNVTGIRRVVDAILKLTSISPPQTAEDIDLILKTHNFVIFGYEWCGYFKRTIDLLNKYKETGYIIVPMDGASEIAKTALAMQLHRPMNRFTSPLVYIRDPGTGRVVYAGNADETLAYITRKYAESPQPHSSSGRT